MAALNDLKVAEVNVQNAINAAIALIQSMKSGSVADADVEAVVTQLNDAAQALSGAVNPPPPTP